MTAVGFRQHLRFIRFLLLALASVVVGPRPARGASNWVIVVRPSSPSPPMTELVTRLQGELVAVGFHVTTIEHDQGTDAPGAIVSFTSRLDLLAVVAVSLESDRANADVWIPDRATGGTKAKHLEVRERRDPEGSTLLAVRAGDLLRGSLVELLSEQLVLSRQQEHPTEPEAPVRVEPVRPEPRTDAELPTSVEAGAALWHSFQNVGPVVSPVVRAGHRPWRWLGFRLGLSGLGSSAVVKGPLGEARVHQQLGLFEATSTLGVRGALRPFVSLGVGAYRISVEGTAQDPYRGTGTSLWAAALDAGAGSRLRLGDRIGLSLEVHALMTSPYPMVRIVDYDAGRTGRPSLFGSLTLVGLL